MISQQNIYQALVDLGLERGSTVFSHANFGFFGPVEGAVTMRDLSLIFLECMKEAVGNEGTLIFPAFTYSFGSQNKERRFNPKKSPTQVSDIANLLIETGEAFRTSDPMLSVVAIGKRAEAVTCNIDTVCFGNSSIWSRLLSHDARICNFNLNSGSTFLHFVERQNKVPHRRDIVLSGTLIHECGEEPLEVTYYGRSLDKPEDQASFGAFHRACMFRGISKQVELGRGSVTLQSCNSAKLLLDEILPQYPSFLTRSYEQR